MLICTECTSKNCLKRREQKAEEWAAGSHINVRVKARVAVWVRFRARIAIFLFVHQHTNKLFLLTIQQSFLNELHNANYFNNGFVQLQGTGTVPVIIKKKNSLTFCPGESLENFINIFQDFPGLTTFQVSKKKSRTFPGCGNPAGRN